MTIRKEEKEQKKSSTMSFYRKYENRIIVILLFLCIIIPGSMGSIALALEFGWSLRPVIGACIILMSLVLSIVGIHFYEMTRHVDNTQPRLESLKDQLEDLSPVITSDHYLLDAAAKERFQELENAYYEIYHRAENAVHPKEIAKVRAAVDKTLSEARTFIGELSLKMTQHVETKITTFQKQLEQRESSQLREDSLPTPPSSDAFTTPNRRTRRDIEKIEAEDSPAPRIPEISEDPYTQIIQDTIEIQKRIQHLDIPQRMKNRACSISHLRRVCEEADSLAALIGKTKAQIGVERRSLSTHHTEANLQNPIKDRSCVPPGDPDSSSPHERNYTPQRDASASCSVASSVDPKESISSPPPVRRLYG